MNRLLQDIYSKDPWKVLVCCVMLNNSNRRSVDKVRHEFFEKYRSPFEIDHDDADDMAVILRPTGLQNVKAKRIIDMSIAYSLLSIGEIDDAVQSMDMPSVGEYARDSWNIFINKDVGVQPEDKELKLYLEGHYGGPRVNGKTSPKVSIK